MDATVISKFHFSGLEGRGIQNPTLAYAESANIDATKITHFSETGKRDGADTIAKLNFLPWQTKFHYEALIEANPNIILGAAGAAAVVANQRQSQDID